MLGIQPGNQNLKSTVAWNWQVNLLMSRVGISVCSVLHVLGCEGSKSWSCVTAGESQTSTSDNLSKIIAKAREQLFQRVFVLKIFF